MAVEALFSDLTFTKVLVWLEYLCRLCSLFLILDAAFSQIEIPFKYTLVLDFVVSFQIETKKISIPYFITAILRVWLKIHLSLFSSRIRK
jgi:hypothetical protein